jgi:PAS domain S-box-containing protein
MLDFTRRSLLSRTIAPIAALLAAIAFLVMLALVHNYRVAAHEALAERARMVTVMLAGGAGEALWIMDPAAADALLAPLEEDPDYLGSTIYSEGDAVFASHGHPNRYMADDVVQVAPINRIEAGKPVQIGRLEIHLSPHRLYDDIRSMTAAIAAICVLVLIVVCGVLVLIVRGVTQPIVRMTDVMTSLASGRTSIEVPARDRRDELGRMAAAVQTFRENAIANERLESEKRRLEELAERERRAAEETLRRSEERFRALIEHSNDMVAVLRADSSLSYCSPSWAADLGWAPSALPDNLLKLTHPDDVVMLRDALTSVAASGARASGRSRLRHRSGAWRHIAWSASNAASIPGVGGIIINARDVTAELALEEQLQQARKLEAIGQLAGGIAHDFNNIMAAVLGFAGFLVKDLPTGSAQHNWAQRIVTAGQRARDLVQQILAFARKSSLERVASDILPIAREARELLHASLPASTELRLEAPTGPLVADVNPTHISQIIVNLCVNANDSLHGEPGHVTIELARVQPGDADHQRIIDGHGGSDDGMFVIGALQATRRYARVRVTDSGSGMPPEVLRRIFDPFFTTKQRGRGTGLGLAMVHGIVADYAGACVVESRPGRGTVFAIYLPLSTEDPEQTGTQKVLRSLGGQERILVVDDEPFLTEMLEVGFGRLGYAVTTAQDPAEALNIFAADPSAFDVVVSDQVMPRMTGLALLGQLRAIRPAVPFILCTGFSDGATEKTATAAGADAFFLKPISPEQIAEKIRELTARA